MYQSARAYFVSLILLMSCVYNKTEAQSTLIHYWHFNNFTTAVSTPDIFFIDADYSTLDTSKARITYQEMPGVSPAYYSYTDPYPAPSSEYDTVNARLGAVPGNALRPRNPADSMELRFYIPTTHYENIVVKYGTESSSLAHGDLRQMFTYSVDSGLTWRTAGLSEPYDSAWVLPFKLVSVAISDPDANNNPKLVFRILFDGNTTGTSGNNRFDNVSVDGDLILASIATLGSYGPFCNTTTSIISVPFTTVGTFTGTYSVQLSNPDGTFPVSLTSNLISPPGTGSPLTAAIPAGTTPSPLYRVRVINTSPVTYGTDNGTDIVVNGIPTSYAVTGGGAFCAGGAGVPIGLANSQPGVSYQLYLGTTPVGSPVTGTGSAISFGNQTTAGTYGAKAYFASTTSCTSNMIGSVTITVHPAPGAISGPTALCPGSTINLTDAVTGGTWSSGTTSVATITSGGMVSGVTTGTTTISYSLAFGCAATVVVTVSAAPTVISGPSAVCSGATVGYSDGIGGGLWTSSNTSVAVIGSLTGNVTGGTVGASTITYSLGGTTCTVTKVISVNPSPSAIIGSASICVGGIYNLSDGTPAGTWSSTSTATATVNSSGSVTGLAAGVATVSYTVAGCAATTVITVNTTPTTISGPSAVCAGSAITLSDAVSGGLWTATGGFISIGSSSGAVSGVSAGIASVTYSIGACTVNKLVTVNPVAALTMGTHVCVGNTVSVIPTITGGTWVASPSPVATISSGGVVTGVLPGISTITYTLPTGCISTTVTSVDVTPTALSGPAVMCQGSNITLTDGVDDGTWTSVPSAVAIVGGTGIVTGLSAGSAVVSYAIGSCVATRSVTVNPVPVISGASGVCVGSTMPLTSSITGGTWSCVPTAIASVSPSGVVTGSIPGTATVTYLLPTGCSATRTITVNSIPTAITGTRTVCVGASTTLGDGAGGGTWSISSTSVATANTYTGDIWGVTAGNTTVTYSLGTGCTVTAIVTVNPLPSPVGGTEHVCVGLSTHLTDPTGGGSWSSLNTALATVDASGTVYGDSAGITTIFYTIPTGCKSAANVTVNPLPAAIVVAGYVCIGIHTTFVDSSTGGTWSCSNTSLATIDPVTGVATGVASGMPTITYTLPTGCQATTTVSVNSIAPTITGTTHVCMGQTTTLSDPLPGGTWTSSDLSLASVSLSGGAVYGVSSGTVLISYTQALFVCPAVTMVTVNPLPAPITGSNHVCAGSFTVLSDTGGGTWSSSNLLVAVIDSAGMLTGSSAGPVTITYTLPVTGCSITAVETVNPLPASIAGAPFVCLGSDTLLHDVSPSGIWSSGDPAIASVSTTGMVSGLSAGSTSITYTIPTGCRTVKSFDVISVPAIGGITNMCGFGSVIYATDSMAGGIWSSSLVTITPGGMITSYTSGAATVTYTLPSGCLTSATFTVNPEPSVITGSGNLCIGLTTALHDSTPGGTWSSSNTGIATVDAYSGIVTGVTAGSATITYMLSGTGCMRMQVVNVNALPAAITGMGTVCAGSTTTYSDAGGGSWYSSNPAVALAGATTGIITGMSAGVATITYDLASSCFATRNITVNPLPAMYPFTGGGSYCYGGAGVDMSLSLSSAGVSYHLYDGTFPVGTDFHGTGGALDFGLQTLPGSYTVRATDTMTGCMATMLGTVTVNINPLPTPYLMTGGGNYCAGGAGVHIGLAVTDPGIHYQLFFGSVATGASVAGTGSSVDFGVFTSAGTYKVIATNTLTGCSNMMVDTLVVVIQPNVIPTIVVSAAPGAVVCAGTHALFSAAVTNGGSAPAYKWKVNGAPVSATGSTYNYVPVNGDTVTAIVTSNASCVVPDTAINSIVMTVDAAVPPTVSINATPGAAVVAGQYDTLTAIVTNGGSSPAYQWSRNGTMISGATGQVYVSNSFHNNDVLSCSVVSSGICSGLSGSGNITINVTSGVGVGQMVFQGSQINVYPNPASSEIMISGTVEANDNSGAYAELTDVTGRILQKDQLDIRNGEIATRIALNGSYPAGVYLLVLHAGGEQKVFHLVIEK